MLFSVYVVVLKTIYTMHYHRAFAWCLLILPSLAEKLVVVRRQGVSIESSVSSTQSPIVTSSSVLSTPLPSSTEQPNVSATTIIDIHTEISSPQPSAQSAQSTALNGEAVSGHLLKAAPVAYNH